MTDTPEMVERVARAIAKDFGEDFDEVPRDKKHRIEAHSIFGGRYRDVNEPFQYDYLGSARAAIEAMREPTEGMGDSGDMAMMRLVEKLLGLPKLSDDHYERMNVAFGKRARGTTEENTDSVWQAMIDAALGKKPL